ncbi:hypothetical protein RP20_CCG011204 [Aedes albopictus]|nr:hypothetical protein RP20_CCG011204 [Aedes albopictus]
MASRRIESSPKEKDALRLIHKHSAQFAVHCWLCQTMTAAATLDFVAMRTTTNSKQTCDRMLRLAMATRHHPGLLHHDSSGMPGGSSGGGGPPNTPGSLLEQHHRLNGISHQQSSTSSLLSSSTPPGTSSSVGHCGSLSVPTGGSSGGGGGTGCSGSDGSSRSSSSTRRDHNIDYSSLFIQLNGTFPTLYSCVSCHKTVSNRWHHANIHRPQSHECPVCGQKFTRRDNMKAHCKVKHPELRDRFYNHIVHM